jgi:hypothetical protein
MRNPKFGCNIYEIFKFSCNTLISHVFFEELLHATMRLKFPKDQRTTYPKKTYFIHKNLDSYNFFNKKITLDST